MIRSTARVTAKVLTGLLWLLSVFGIALSHAQEYPHKTIRLIVPNAPSASSDVVARMIVNEASKRLGAVGLTSLTALLITLGGLGQAGAWFAASGRLPFVAGIDRFLPAAFGRVHPRYGSPHVSLLAQAAIAAAFVFLSQAGTTVKGAYDVLVSMSIIGYFIPYLFIFASMIKLQTEPAGPGIMRVPGGRPVATLLGATGFCVTAAAIALALVPAEDEPDPALAVTKVVGLTALLVLAGAAVYVHGKRRRR